LQVTGKPQSLPVTFSLSEFEMGPITEVTFFTMFAGAKCYTLFLFESKFLWREVATRMGTVAEGLFCTFTAGAKPVVAGFQFQGDG
jgi:hypothetical protein